MLWRISTSSYFEVMGNHFTSSYFEVMGNNFTSSYFEVVGNHFTSNYFEVMRNHFTSSYFEVMRNHCLLATGESNHSLRFLNGANWMSSIGSRLAMRLQHEPTEGGQAARHETSCLSLGAQRVRVQCVLQAEMAGMES